MLIHDTSFCPGVRRDWSDEIGQTIASRPSAMSISDLRCDLCGRILGGPAAGVRFVYHPGVPALRDDSGLACVTCWDELVRGLDVTAAGLCAACAELAPWRQSLHVRRFDIPGSWRL